MQEDKSNPLLCGSNGASKNAPFFSRVDYFLLILILLSLLLLFWLFGFCFWEQIQRADYCQRRKFKNQFT